MLKRLSLLLALSFSQLIWANPEPLELVLTDIDGKEIRLSDYRGKWVVLNYWATWCPPCLAEIPELVHFHESHKDDDAVVIGVDMERLQPEVLRQFIDDNFMTYPIVPMTETMPMFDNVENFPTTYLFDPNGIGVVKHVGAVTSEAIEQFIDSYQPAETAKR